MNRYLPLVAAVVCSLAASIPAPWSAAQDSQKPDFAQIESDFSSEDVETRRNAVYALTALGADAAPAAHIAVKGLADADQQVWAQSIETIANVGPAASDAIPVLIEQFSGSTGGRRFFADSQRNYRVAFALGRIGSAAIDPLTEQLTHSDPRVRQGVVTALGFAHEHAAPIVPKLIALLNDPDEFVRDETAEALGKIGEPAAQALADALSSEAANTRHGAAIALGLLNRDAAVAELPLILVANNTAEQAETRSAALVALGLIGSQSKPMLDTFIRSLDSDNQAVRDAAVEGLITAPNAIDKSSPTLIAKLDSQQIPTRDAAAYLLGFARKDTQHIASALINHLKPGTPEPAPIALALGRLGPEVVPPLLDAARDNLVDTPSLQLAVETIGPLATANLLQALESEHPAARLAAATALAGIRSDDAQLPIKLAAALSDTEAPVRAAAATAIGNLESVAPHQIDQLIAAASDSDPIVRARSVAALAHLSVDPDKLSPVLVATLQDPEPAVRAEAAAAVASNEQPLPATVPALIKTLTDADDTVRINSAQALASMGSEAGPAVEPLIKALEDSQTPVRAAAAKAIAAIGSPAADAAVPALAALINQPDMPVRIQAIQALGAIGPAAEPVASVLFEAAHADNPTLREHAATAIVTVVTDKQRLIPEMVTLLHDDTWTVRRSATLALAELGPDAAPASGRLFELLESNDDRSDARDALRKIDAATPDALPQVLAAYRSNDRGSQYMAIRYLGLLGPAAAPALDELREAAEKADSRRMRALIESTIEKIDIPEPEQPETDEASDEAEPVADANA